MIYKNKGSRRGEDLSSPGGAELSSPGQVALPGIGRATWPKHDMGRFTGRNSRKVRGSDFKGGSMDGHLLGVKTVSRFSRTGYVLYFDTELVGLCPRYLAMGIGIGYHSTSFFGHV
jgi:hypothetical protein